MLKFYRHYATIYRNGKELGRQFGGTGLTDSIPENTVDTLEWDNLSEYYHKHGLSLPFSVYTGKKGRLVSFFSDITHRDLKEWREPLNLTVKHEYVETTVSIEYVLSWHDGEKAIQYLLERGLQIMKVS